MFYLAKAIAVLLILAVAYLFGAFVNWEASPADWSGFDRLAIAAAALYFVYGEFSDRGPQE